MISNQQFRARKTVTVSLCGQTTQYSTQLNVIDMQKYVDLSPL